jgi:chromosome segregation ATPase
MHADPRFFNEDQVSKFNAGIQETAKAARDSNPLKQYTLDDLDGLEELIKKLKGQRSDLAGATAIRRSELKDLDATIDSLERKIKLCEAQLTRPAISQQVREALDKNRSRLQDLIPVRANTVRLIEMNESRIARINEQLGQLPWETINEFQKDRDALGLIEEGQDARTPEYLKDPASSGPGTLAQGYVGSGGLRSSALGSAYSKP